MAIFGERLRELREERGLTQPELADALGVSKNTVFVWEKEKRRPKKTMIFSRLQNSLAFHTSILWEFRMNVRRSMKK